jgi:Flp pilus assembly protein TadD
MVQLKHAADRETSADKRLPLVRAFSSVQASYIERGQAQFEQKHYDLAEFYFQIVSEASPEEIWPVLLLAENSAARGNRKQAISRLRQTAKLGLANPEAYQNDRNLQNLRDDPEFKKFLSDLKTGNRK